jgi:glucose/arabinose dehydrogenase
MHTRSMVAGLAAILALTLSAVPAVSLSIPGQDTTLASTTVADLSHLSIDSTKTWTGFNRPNGVMNAGDGSGRLFVCEQTGDIKVIDGAVVQPTPYLDLTSKVLYDAGERGLCGLVFSPGFKTNGRFYVDYIDKSGNTVLARYVVSNPASDTPNILSVQTILHVKQPGQFHKSGCLQFGPDGYLYVGLGDGGVYKDPANNAQNRKVLLGKILRIDTGDRRGTTPFAGTYRIPPSNPYAKNTHGWRKEIWAYGLRNPWRFSFDAGSGNLWIGDVGQDQYEEVDFQHAGKGGLNWGWHVWEGNHRFTTKPKTVSRKGYAFPIMEIAQPLAEAVIGGYVYRGAQYPVLKGTYVFGDLNGHISAIRRYSVAGAALKHPETKVLTQTVYNITSFGQSESRELYFTTLGGSVCQVTATAH